MTPRRSLLAAVALPALLLTAGCTSSDGGGSTEGAPVASTSPGAGDAATPPPLAGRAEAEVVAALPEGPATGTAVLTYSGLGELRAPFAGECSRDGDTTRIEGSADTADITLDVAPDGVQLELDDVGLAMRSGVATGRYDVEGNHLSLSAPLVSGDQSIGHVELAVDCGS